MSVTQVPFRSEWIQKTVLGIGKMKGMVLGAAIVDTQSDDFILSQELPAIASSNDAVAGGKFATTLVKSLTALRTALTDQYTHDFGSPTSDAAVTNYIEMMTRLAGSSLLFLLQKRYVEDWWRNQQRAEGPEEQAATAAGAATTTTSGFAPFEPNLTLLKGILFAFEIFQVVHSAPRDANDYNGFPGWDTAALLTFIHITQNASKACRDLDDDTVGEFVRSWRKLFVFLQGADADCPNSKSRRRGALAVVNGLLMILFQRHSTHQARIIMQTVESGENLSETTHDPLKSVLKPASHLIAENISFRYFQGRIKLYDRDNTFAFNSLFEAYALSPPFGQEVNGEQRRNKQRIMLYLLVAAVLCGLEPPATFLDQDSTLCGIFTPLLSAMRHGSPAAYSLALELNAGVLRRRGLYLLLQQARILCYLTLLQRVHGALGATPGKDPSMIKFSVVAQALQAVNHSCCDETSPHYLFAYPPPSSSSSAASPPTSITHRESQQQYNERLSAAKAIRVEVNAEQESDDIALWIARLITQDHVKGYLSYEHQTLVLSKKEPFPKLASRRLGAQF